MEVRTIVAKSDGWVIVLDENGELCTIMHHIEKSSLKSSKIRAAGAMRRVSAISKTVRLIAVAIALIACVAVSPMAIVGASIAPSTEEQKQV